MESTQLTVTEVSRRFGVSPRMLRHYEKLGLIQSARRENYAYRVYDGESVERLRQILILRRLRIPLRQIRQILESPVAVTAIGVFTQSLRELDREIDTLSSIRSILSHFLEELERASHLPLHHLLTGDEVVLQAVESLAVSTIKPKEESLVKEWSNANEPSRLTDIRIVYLPPMWVAASHHVGEEPEARSNDAIARFVRESALLERYPELRHFGFNHPNPVDETGYHGYEAWVTIPEGMEVPSPLEKKRFPGGLYAAHMVPFGNFQEWDWMLDWASASEDYDFAGDLTDQEHMCGLLEEHLNYYSHVIMDNTEPEELQMDLLMPVRLKEK